MPTKSPANRPKKSVIDALKSILVSRSASTQDEIILALQQQGHLLNQSKVSRLLRKVGAIKTTNEHNQIIYTLPYEPAPPMVKNVLAQLIVDITTNETLIVVHTNPGSASLIARSLDHNNQELHILGTVAGDDTLFIAPKSIKKIDKSLQAIKNFFTIAS